VSALQRTSQPTTGRFSSVRGQLAIVVLLTTALALLTMTGALLYRDLTEYRRAKITDVTTEADIITLLTTPALAFEDRQTAERNLAALSAKPDVLIAALYSVSDDLYASYVRRDAQPPPTHVQGAPAGVRFADGKLEVRQPIQRNGEYLGTLYLSAAYNPWAHVRAYVGVLGLMMVLSLGIALILSARLRRRITGPVEALAAVADDIVTRRDPSLRAPPTPIEEFAVVVQAFNSVLDESEARTRELQESNRAVTQEMHERAAAESALALATTRLESAMAAAEMGSWMWNLESGEVTLDRNLAALYGRPADAPLHGDAALLHQQIHPEDLPRVQAAEQQALHSGHLASTEYRILLPDQGIRWVVSRGTVHHDAGQRPVMLLGLLIDISAQRMAERALRKSENLYRAIGESIDYGVWVTDADGRNIYASDSFLRLLGITQAECTDLGWSQALHPDDVEGTIAAWRECVRTGGVWYREHRFRGADERYHPVLAQGVPMRDEDGRITGWAGINLDIARMKKTENALRKANRRKDDFLATLAHELRNPLAPIRHAARLLGIRGLEPAQSQMARDIIGRQVARMALLLDDLLEVSRITRGRLELRKEHVSLATVVKAAVETSKPLLDSKQHEFIVRLPGAPVELDVDPLRISQALSNLLTNAAKYTDAGGQIELEVHCQAGETVFAVRDSGIGLPAASIPTIFEMFSQVDSAIDRSEGGLGIGLALVKGLVALHGGTVDAASEGPGKGSVFTMRLPGGRVVEQAVARDAGPATPAATTSRGRILVVDDNIDAATTLAMVLRSYGHSVETADSGRAGLQAGEQQRPDVVILDIGMPEMNGYEVARRMRQTSWGSSALLVALTGWGQKEDIERAHRAGFDSHMTKPADPEEIEALLEEFLRSRRGAEAARETSL